MSDEGAVERSSCGPAEILIGEHTICDHLFQTAQRFGDAPAMSVRAGAEWRTRTWCEVREAVLRVAAALHALGVEPGDRVAIMASNRPEHVIADLGALHAGAVPTTVYSTLAAEQLAFVANDSAARVAIVEGPDELARWQAVRAQLPELRRIVVLEPAREGDAVAWSELLRLGAARLTEHQEEVERRWNAVTADDPATLIYTSGTTGSPKGVLLSHRNVLYQANISREGGAPERPVTVSYLPLAHIAEKAFSLILPVVWAGHVYFCPDPNDLPDILREVRPTLFFGVPRVWEKLYTGLSALLRAESDQAKRQTVEDALEAGRRYVESTQFGSQPTPEIEQAHARAEAVLTPLRAALGLDRVVWAGSAAAPLPVEIARFFAGVGLRIFDIYGMSETTGAVTANRPTEFRLGSVGRPGPGIRIAVADDGEILVRGPLIMSGYLNRPDATAELIDRDGWVHTGDVGWLDAEGFLWVTDRKKELIITSSGKNISPAHIENLLKTHELVGQAVVYGDRKPYLVAVVVLEPEAVRAWASAKNRSDLAGPDPREAAQDPQLRAELAQAVDAVNQRLARPEQIKRFEVVVADWHPGGEEVTPTHKLRRTVIYDKYASLFESLYG